MRQRTLSRELALQVIYRLNFQKDTTEATINASLDELSKSSGHNAGTAVEYANELVKGYVENSDRIDEAIRKSSANWEFQRIALIDRAILQIAAYELLCRTDIPQAVSINEAIELAKKYGGPHSSNFVNGILDKIAAENKK